MIMTVTTPHKDPRTNDKERPWAITVRRGSMVETFRFKTQGDALTALGSFIGQGYNVI